MARRKHGTVAATPTITDVDLDAQSGKRVRVINRGAGTIYARGDGTSPAVAGDDTVVIPPGGWAIVDCKDADADGDVVVRMIADVATAYSVEVA